MSHYTQTAGTAEGNQYFQDVEISPATLKSGALQARFDTLTYPRAGKKADLAATTVVTTASSTTPVHATPVTLTATAHTTSPNVDVPSGLVTFKDGATSIGTATPNGSGVATLVVSGGFTAGAHSITSLIAADGDTTAATSAALVITAS